MSDYLVLWRGGGPIDAEAALDLSRRLLRESRWRPRKTEGAVGRLVRNLDQVFPQTGPPWTETPHICGNSYVILQVLTSRLPEVMNVAIPLALQAGMTAFVPSTRQMYLPTDIYTPEPLLPSLGTVIGDLTGSADLSEVIQVELREGLEEIGFRRGYPEGYVRETKDCMHLVNPILRQCLDGTVVLRVSVGVRFEAAERIRAAADRPEMKWESRKTHPTVGCTLSQLASELPTQWRIRSVEEARRIGARVVVSIRNHAEPYFRKYSDPDVVLDALVENGEEARWLGSDSSTNSSHKRALTTLALGASSEKSQQLGDVIAMMRGLVEKEGPAAVRGFDRFADKLRSLKDPS